MHEWVDGWVSEDYILENFNDWFPLDWERERERKNQVNIKCFNIKWNRFDCAVSVFIFFAIMSVQLRWISSWLFVSNLIKSIKLMQCKHRFTFCKYQKFTSPEFSCCFRHQTLTISITAIKWRRCWWFLRKMGINLIIFERYLTLTWD